MTIAESIWDRCVPCNLLSKYRRHLRRTDMADSGRGKKAEVLACMMEGVRVTTKGVKHTRRRATTTAFLRPKSKVRCRLLLNPDNVHKADARRPLRFQLPRLEGLGHWMAYRRGRRRGRRAIYLAKIDLTSCHWSIRLPRRWRRVFVIRVGGRAYRITQGSPLAGSKAQPSVNSSWTGWYDPRCVGKRRRGRT